MNIKTPGCFSSIGLVITLLALLVILGTGLLRGGVMFSPGDLNNQPGNQILGGVRSHAQTAGQCSACHAAPWSQERMSDLCLECHTDLMDEAQDFHTIMLAESRKQACYACHTDHNGVQGSQTVVSLTRFPHNTLGYSLKGHQIRENGKEFACSDCHTEGISHFDVTTCITCHSKINPAYVEIHTGTFGQDCMACHDGIDTFGEVFDHIQTDFPLTGEHAALTCDRCHANMHSVADLAGTPKSCFACHLEDDAHQGNFGEDCAGCHTADGWQQATFDHELTAFPLTGAHIEVPCAECHKNNEFSGTSQECLACHTEPIYHAGLFEPTCQTCHTTRSWTPARFEQTHIFPIDHGESGLSDCKVCHVDNLTAYTCYGCHEHNPAEIAEEHREERIQDFENCMRCHPTGREEEGERDDD